MFWIILLGILMVILALIFEALTGPMSVRLVVATVLGVLAAVVLGTDLMAAAFFSGKSGIDDEMTHLYDQKEKDKIDQ